MMKYTRWTPLTAFCFERGCRCKGCCELNVACKTQHGFNPYGIKMVKYAAIKTFANIGLKGYEGMLE